VLETQKRTAVDPATSEILVGACKALVDEADDILERASMGMVIRESRDYCAVVADRHGNVIATGSKDLPAFVGTIQFTIQSVISEIGVENFEKGHIYLSNDPWGGGTHNNDLRLVAPVYHEGSVVGYVGSAGHVTDIGGMNPGSFAIRPPSAYAEGLRITPVLLYSGGEVNRDVMSLILANIRVGNLTHGDLLAMIAATNRAAVRLTELADVHGHDELVEWMEDYQDHGEAALLEQLSDLKPGRYEFVDWIDEDPVTGEPKEIRLAVEVSPEKLVYDFTGSAPQSLGSANATYSTTAALVYVVTAYIFFPQIPLNHGMMRKIEIIAPAGSVVNADFPSPVSAMATTTFDIVAACIMGAFSKIVPDRVIAASYNLQSFITSGYDPRYESEFVTYSWGPGGWGASSTVDGRVSMALYTNTTTNIPCEAEERRIPFIIEEYAIVADSGGAGRRRGGNCLRRVFRFNYRGSLTSLAGRGKFPIWGLFGGEPGEAQLAQLETRDGVNDIGLLAEGIELRPGDRLIYKNGGGGGYGKPTEREPELVLDDVLDGWVTPKKALDVYLVGLSEIPDTSLTTTYEIDWDETDRLRSTKGQNGS
jgi:N-methylhydantoinase B